MHRLSLIILWSLLQAPPTVGFGVSRPAPLPLRSFRPLLSSSSSAQATNETKDSLAVEKLRGQSVRELKQQLKELGISCNDLFEKEELVQRLYQSLQKGKQRAPRDADQANDVIVVPLKLIALRDNVSVLTKKAGDEGSVRFEPTDQPYAVMDLNLGVGRQLSLMVDTACSGIVLKSQVVRRYNLPSLSTPVTMSGASGVAETTQLTELPPFSIGYDGRQQFFDKKLPAAIQDVDSLPSSIDGIIGLSFLSFFHTVEFDYTTEEIRFYEKEPPAVLPEKIVAQGDLKLLGSLGVYTVDVMLGKCGPVRMIVDTGGSNTFLSWKGVADLGLNRQSKAVSPISQAMGAVGNTGQAFLLTHRIHVSSELQLLPASSNSGLSLGGTKRLAIDIGEIPLLQMLASQGVGGILGLDVFSRCKIIRIGLQGSRRTLNLME